MTAPVIVGVGVDAVDVPRFRKVLQRRPGITARLFSDDEMAYASRFRDPTQRLAARFAAKEAAMKALGVGLGAFRLRDVEVVKAPSGAPALVLRDGAAAVAERRDTTAWHLALTHTDTVAIAFAVAVGPEPASASTA